MLIILFYVKEIKNILFYSFEKKEIIKFYLNLIRHYSNILQDKYGLDLNPTLMESYLNKENDQLSAEADFLQNRVRSLTKDVNRLQTIDSNCKSFMKASLEHDKFLKGEIETLKLEKLQLKTNQKTPEELLSLAKQAYNMFLRSFKNRIAELGLDQDILDLTLLNKECNKPLSERFIIPDAEFLEKKLISIFLQNNADPKDS